MLLIDPAGAYFAQHSPARRGPVFSEAAVFGPGVQGGSRQATEQEIRERSTPTGQRPFDEVDLRSLLASDAVAQAVADLFSSGSTVLESATFQVRARVVRFWRGDSILELGGGNRRSRVRIPRDIGPDSGDLLAFHLSAFLAGR